MSDVDPRQYSITSCTRIQCGQKQGHHHNGKNRSGHSTIAHTAFAHLGIWWKLDNCSKHTFRAWKCLIKRALLTVSSISNRLPAMRKGIFDPLPQVLGSSGTWEVGDGPFRLPTHGFLIGPYWHIWSISNSFELLAGWKKHFHPPRIRWQLPL